MLTIGTWTNRGSPKRVQNKLWTSAVSTERKQILRMAHGVMLASHRSQRSQHPLGIYGIITRALR